MISRLRDETNPIRICDRATVQPDHPLPCWISIQQVLVPREPDASERVIGQLRLGPVI
jgi:hypothetical protein